MPAKNVLKIYVESFTRSLLTKYSTYFNKRYQRIGSLFQGTYKAVLIDDENYLLHLSRYIHLNPFENAKDTPLHSHYSSYGDYLDLRKTKWIDTSLILSFFKNTQKLHLKDILSYQSFVEDYPEDPKEILGQLIIEET